MLDIGFWMGRANVSSKRPAERGNVRKKWICNFLLGENEFEGMLREVVEIYCVNSALSAYFDCWAECAQQRSVVVERSGLGSLPSLPFVMKLRWIVVSNQKDGMNRKERR